LRVALLVDSCGVLSNRSKPGCTHDRSRGVAGCEEPPMVCAKLDIGALFGRGFPRPALPIGTPPPNAQVAPLPATRSNQHQHVSSLNHRLQLQEGLPYPSFHSAVTSTKHSCSVVFVADSESRLASRVGIEVQLLERNRSARVV
jgi:hypothetical protein